jgi:hypothetical protein
MIGPWTLHDLLCGHLLLQFNATHCATSRTRVQFLQFNPKQTVPSRNAEDTGYDLCAAVLVQHGAVLSLAEGRSATQVAVRNLPRCRH